MRKSLFHQKRLKKAAAILLAGTFLVNGAVPASAGTAAAVPAESAESGEEASGGIIDGLLSGISGMLKAVTTPSESLKGAQVGSAATPSELIEGFKVATPSDMDVPEYYEQDPDDKALWRFTDRNGYEENYRSYGKTEEHTGWFEVDPETSVTGAAVDLSEEYASLAPYEYELFNKGAYSEDTWALLEEEAAELFDGEGELAEFVAADFTDITPKGYPYKKDLSGFELTVMQTDVQELAERYASFYGEDDEFIAGSVSSETGIAYMTEDEWLDSEEYASWHEQYAESFRLATEISKRGLTEGSTYTYAFGSILNGEGDDSDAHWILFDFHKGPTTILPIMNAREERTDSIASHVSDFLEAIGAEDLELHSELYAEIIAKLTDVYGTLWSVTDDPEFAHPLAKSSYSMMRGYQAKADELCTAGSIDEAERDVIIGLVDKAIEGFLPLYKAVGYDPFKIIFGWGGNGDSSASATFNGSNVIISFDIKAQDDASTSSFIYHLSLLTEAERAAQWSSTMALMDRDILVFSSSDYGHNNGIYGYNAINTDPTSRFGTVTITTAQGNSNYAHVVGYVTVTDPQGLESALNGRPVQWICGYSGGGNNSMNYGTFGDGTISGLTAALNAALHPDYTVKFSGNGSTGGSMADQTISYGASTPLSSNGFTRTGYTFQGWSTSSTATSPSYSNGQSVTNLAAAGGSITLYAVWKVNSYAVTLNKGAGISTVSGAGNKNYGTSVTVSAVLKPGYTWKNWTGTYTSASQNYTFTMPASAVTLTANATANQYNVTFSSTGATNPGTGSAKVTFDQTPGQITAPTKTGYNFEGFFTGQNGGGTKYFDGTGKGCHNWDIASDTTLYAHFTPITYTIAFDGNGATSGSVASGSYTYDSPKALPANNFARTGYTYQGWGLSPDAGVVSFLDGESVQNLTTTHNSTVKLYAQWAPISYTIKFNPGYPGAATQEVTAVYDADMAAPTPVRRGWTFLGWNTAEDGSGTNYPAGTNIVNLANAAGAAVTIYGTWERTKVDLALTLEKGEEFLPFGQEAVTFRIKGGEYVYDVLVRPGETASLKLPLEDYEVRPLVLSRYGTFSASSSDSIVTASGDTAEIDYDGGVTASITYSGSRTRWDKLSHAAS